MDRPTMYNVRRSHGEPGPAKVLAPYWAQSHSASLGLFIRSLALLFLLLFLLLLSSPRRPGELLKLYSRALKQRKRHKNNTTLLPGRQYEGRFHHRSCPPSLSLSFSSRAESHEKRRLLHDVRQKNTWHFYKPERARTGVTETMGVKRKGSNDCQLPDLLSVNQAYSRLLSERLIAIARAEVRRVRGSGPRVCVSLLPSRPRLGSLVTASPRNIWASGHTTLPVPSNRYTRPGPAVFDNNFHLVPPRGHSSPGRFPGGARHRLRCPGYISCPGTTKFFSKRPARNRDSLSLSVSRGMLRLSPYGAV